MIIHKKRLKHSCFPTVYVLYLETTFHEHIFGTSEILHVHYCTGMSLLYAAKKTKTLSLQNIWMYSNPQSATDRYKCVTRVAHPGIHSYIFEETAFLFSVARTTVTYPYIFKRLLLLQYHHLSYIPYGHVLHQFSLESSLRMKYFIWRILLDVRLQWIFITACLWPAIIHLTFIHWNDYDLNSRLQLSTRRNVEFEMYLWKLTRVISRQHILNSTKTYLWSCLMETSWLTHGNLMINACES